MYRYLLNLSYIGTGFRGAQKQSTLKQINQDDPLTIQGQLEIGLKLLKPTSPISVVTSSRTDAGVHALHNTMHVDLTSRSGIPYNPNTLTIILNKYFQSLTLPIRLLKTYLVPKDFHCRRNAISRTYMYRLVVIKSDYINVASLKQHIPIEEYNRALFLCTNTFDVDKFTSASQLFLGLHDFRSFMGKASKAPDKITRRKIDKLEIIETQPTCYSSYSWPQCMYNNKSDYTFYNVICQSPGFLYNQCSVNRRKKSAGRMVGTRVYVGGLPYGATERDLERFFRGYGRMRDVLIKNGYGFVEFDDYRDADDAVYELNGKKLLGERVTVEKARGTPRGRDQWSSRNDYRSHERYGPPTRTNHRLIVENLSSRVSWQDLKDYMRQAGEVTYADAHKQHRNEGVVEFASYSDMKNALEKLDDTEINGRRIRLIEDRSSSRRSRSGSYSSRSRSRSRSVKRSHSHSSQDCCEESVLLEYSIRNVLSIGVEPSCKYENIQYKFVECLDLPETSIVKVLEDNCIPYINDSLSKNENILIHCNAGVSRSSAIVIGYLILEHKLEYNDAYALVKQARPCIKPNVGFESQLVSLK
ncbi:RNA recognition motif [Popillia japonica]|uniref:RNA recognition motif n=1 Tax=Popillia japonica TaxID=7064 RepID=A0AAW1KGT9_POPJA